jgi:hypothetical protein
MKNWNDYPNNNTAIPLFVNTFGTGGTAQTISSAGVGIFVNASASFLTTGITFTANFASRTGIHLINIPSGTITGSNVTCTVFYTSGTVDGVSVTNGVVGVFSVGRYGQAPDNFSGLSINSSGFVNANVMQYNGATAPSGDFTQAMKNTIVTAASSGVSGAMTISGGLPNVNISRWGNAVAPSGDFTQSMKNSLVSAAGSGVTTNLTLASGSVMAYLSGDLTPTMKTSVNTEVLDVLNVDTFAQPGQGTPPATATPLQMFGYLYKAWRNKKGQSSGEYILYNDDATTVDHKASVTGTTTVVVGEITSGP